MFKRIVQLAVRRGAETAVAAAAETAATATTKDFLQRFDVTLPMTVYVKASQCNVTVKTNAGGYVELSASLRASFGWEFVSEQDNAGIYIVARRKPVVGSLSTASFTLSVPPAINLILHLNPGSIRLMDVNGKINFPAGSLMSENNPPRLPK